MERAHWIPSCGGPISSDVDRIYLGHETRVDQIPVSEEIQPVVRRLNDTNQRLTLVTPFLVEDELDRMCHLLEQVANWTEHLEVVCNDWGLLAWLSDCEVAEPTIGRLLAGQATDPRLAALDMPPWQQPHERTVFHVDGTEVQLKYRRPTPELQSHLRRCAITVPAVLSFLDELKVRRIELSNPLQGMETELKPGWSASLHLPEVPLAISRHPWDPTETDWLHPTFPVSLQHRDNFVYYCNAHELTERRLAEFQVDRIVHRVTA